MADTFVLSIETLSSWQQKRAVSKPPIPYPVNAGVGSGLLYAVLQAIEETVLLDPLVFRQSPVDAF